MSDDDIKYKALPEDWPDDFAHENGMYQCRCIDCLRIFTGHKRRVTCRLCASRFTGDVREQ